MEEKADSYGLGGPVALGKRLRASLISLVGIFMSRGSSFPGSLPSLEAVEYSGESNGLGAPIPGLEC